MFLRIELMKKVKEEVFRQNLRNDINPFLNTKPEDLSREDVLKNINFLSNIKNNNKKLFLKECLEDLLKTFENNQNEYSFTTGLAIGIERNVLIANARVDRKLESVSKDYIELFEILKTFKEDTFIVGGYVRDAIALRESNDLDLCTSIPYNELEKVFKEHKWETKDTGKSFLVLNVKHPETKENFEIAALRKDKDNSAAEIGTIFEDARRRDFVNSAVYYSLKKEKLIDPSGMAIKDCLENKLRFMGKPEDRIKEDLCVF